MFVSHPVPIIYGSPPLLRPKPIRPTIDTNVRSASVARPPAQPKHARRPTVLRASTLDGRSLSEVINAARRASLNEQHKRASKSPASIAETKPSNPQSRRMSFDDPPASFAHTHPNPPGLSGSRADSFSDPCSYHGHADLK